MTEASEIQRQPIKFGALSIILTAMAVLAASGAITAEFLEVEGRFDIVVDGWVWLARRTMALIILVAFLSYDKPTAVYKWAIIVGLVFSLAGDILLMLPGDLFLNGLISFALAHVIYTFAFVNVGGFYSNWKAAIPLLLFGIFMATVLWQGLQDDGMLIPAMVYLVIILVMAWQSFGQWRQTGETRSWLAFIGAMLFIASDPILILGTYYPAQWLIGQSAGRKHR